MNIGHASTNAEFLYVLNGQSTKDWERVLKEKLDTKEILKKCEVLCKRIRSLRSNKSPIRDDSKADEDNYDKVIFCVDAKAIKKFKKSRSKNMQRAPRRSRARTNMRVSTKLTKDVLQSEMEKVNKIGEKSVGSSSVTRGQASKRYTDKNRDGSASLYS